MRIYNIDGGYKEVSEDQVEIININFEDVLKLEKYKYGVNVHFKNGKTLFFNNCDTDGNAIVFNIIKEV